MVPLALPLLLALGARAAPSLPDPLDPSAFAAAVLAENAGLRASEAATAAARARRDGAEALPETRLSVELAPGLLGEDPPAYQVELEQMLPAWGTRPAQRAGAEAGIREAEAELARARARLRAAAVSALADRWLAEQRVAAMREQRALMASLLESARGRLAAGRGSGAEALMIEAEIARMDAELAMEQAAVEAAGARMRGLLGAPPELPLPALSLPLPSAPAAAADPPAVRAARARAEAADADRALMKAMSRPMLGLMVGETTMMGDGMAMTTVGAELVLPWGARARQDEAAAMAAMAAADVEAMSDETAAMAAEAEAGARAARARLEILEGRALPLAEQRLEAERAMLAAGMGELEDVLDAARARAAARSEAAAARAELWRMSAERDATLGQTAPSEITP